MSKIPFGYCHCGCGKKTSISKSTSHRENRIKGKPYMYLRGHNFRRSFLERFWEKVDVRGKDECWLWKTFTDPNGYGRTSEYIDGKKKMWLAHRASYWIHNNFVLSDSDLVLHSCDTPSCVNPNHLFIGTHLDNTRDMMKKGRARGGVSAGSKNFNAVLTESDVIEIRALLPTMSQASIGKMYGVTKTSIGRIERRETWKHIP